MTQIVKKDHSWITPLTNLRTTQREEESTILSCLCREVCFVAYFEAIKAISEADSVSSSWSRFGRNLYRIHGDKAGQILQEQARSVERSCQADTRVCEAALSQIEEELEKTQQELDQELRREGVTLEKARGKVKGSVFRLVVSSLMVVVGICIIAWSLRPTFYGMDLPWVVISAGSGLAIFVVMEVLDEFVFFIFTPPLIVRLCQIQLDSPFLHISGYALSRKLSCLP